LLSRALTFGPGHHFFGFHDVSAWNSAGDKSACLRVSVINRPPAGDDVAEAGFVDERTGQFHPLVETTAFNFPQGGRQLWIPGQDAFWVNKRLSGVWGAVLVDAQTGNTREIDQGLYALSPDGSTGYGLNFARLNRLGGYGYVGYADPTINEARPANDGIFRVDLMSGKVDVLLSTADAAAGVSSTDAAHHYVTHVVPSPSGERLLFLHRWWLPDGGVGSRLMSVSKEGRDLVCHAEGFLSHFDWWDDHRIIIWGRLANSTDRLRRLSGAQRFGGALKLIKRLVRVVRPRGTGAKMSFLLIDTRDASVQPFWPELLPEDGHPMFCPANRDWLSIDTYPDADRVRQLKVLNATTGKVLDLGRFRYADLTLERNMLSKCFEHVDAAVLANVKGDSLAFARSGLHCDLHPRWRRDGRLLGFDSTHEGSRQVYVCDVELGE